MNGELLQFEAPWWCLPGVGSGCGRLPVPLSSSASGGKARELVPESESCTSCKGEKKTARGMKKFSMNGDCLFYFSALNALGHKTKHSHDRLLTKFG